MPRTVYVKLTDRDPLLRWGVVTDARTGKCHRLGRWALTLREGEVFARGTLIRTDVDGCSRVRFTADVVAWCRDRDAPPVRELTAEVFPAGGHWGWRLAAPDRVLAVGNSADERAARRDAAAALQRQRRLDAIAVWARGRSS